MHNSKKEITKALRWLRMLGSSVKVTGEWTIGMASAVACFQKKNKLTPTGELDSVTWVTLKRSIPWWKRF